VLRGSAAELHRSVFSEEGGAIVLSLSDTLTLVRGILLRTDPGVGAPHPDLINGR